MTDQEINIAIAESLGWKRGKSEYYEDGLVWTSESGRCPTCDLPDYCHDLNAMREAEVELENEIATADQYWTELAELTMADDEELSTCTRYRYIGNATARQRAEAFLRVKGLWK